MPGIRSAHGANGKLWRMALRKITWTNLWFEQQLDSILSGGVGVEWEFLPFDKVVIVGLDGMPSKELTERSVAREKEKNRSYSEQLGSRYLSEKTGKYEDYEKQSRPTEYRDCALMQLVGVASDGLLGHVSPQTQP